MSNLSLHFTITPIRMGGKYKVTDIYQIKPD